jgi:hypothetical protein
MNESNGLHGGNRTNLKRASTAVEDRLPRKVRRRNNIQPVQRQLGQFWDKPLVPTKTATKKNFVHAFRRASSLKEFKLLHEYDPIEAEELRLLFIHPAMKHDMDLVVSMEVLKDCATGEGLEQEYEALSYHWGPGPADKPVYLSNQEGLQKVPISSLAQLKLFVPDYHKGKRFYVRPNLDKALRYLRDKKETVILWVDAICINQSDEKVEKPAQIAKMKDIYNKASNVCIWLGDGKAEGKRDRSKDFHAAMDFIQNIIQLKELEVVLQDTQTTKYWSDFLDLIRCSWFSRRWVIQELALAREASVHCGYKSVSWQEFADAIGLFSLNFNSIRTLFRQSREDTIYRNYKNFDELAPLGAKVLVDAVTNAFRRNIDHTIIEPVFALETLVSDLCSFESSDPRDTIFALLNITRESVEPKKSEPHAIHPPIPNYGKDILEVYTDFLEYVVYTTDSIDIMCRQWAIPERENPGGRKNGTPVMALPSWIQTITKSTWGYQEQGFNGRINGDSIVGKAGRRRYNASRWKKPEVRFGKRRPLDANAPQMTRSYTEPAHFSRNSESILPNHMLRGFTMKPTSAHFFVNGIEIGTVSWTYGPVSRGVIPKVCLEKGGWNHGTETARVPDRLWRTLVADRNADGENPDPWYHRAALHCMALADNNGDIATHELLDPGTYAHDNQPQIVTEYLKRVQSVSWNRKFIECADTPDPGVEALNQTLHESEPNFGLAPPDTDLGDRICILFGCSVPCVLRPLNDGTGHYVFVGEAYVYGKMDGEAIAAMSSDSELRKATKEFIII